MGDGGVSAMMLRVCALMMLAPLMKAPPHTLPRGHTTEGRFRGAHLTCAVCRALHIPTTVRLQSRTHNAAQTALCTPHTPLSEHQAHHHRRRRVHTASCLPAAAAAHPTGPAPRHRRAGGSPSAEPRPRRQLPCLSHRRHCWSVPQADQQRPHGEWIAARCHQWSLARHGQRVEGGADVQAAGGHWSQGVLREAAHLQRRERLWPRGGAKGGSWRASQRLGLARQRPACAR
jgi:hypothetical protein